MTGDGMDYKDDKLSKDQIFKIVFDRLVTGYYPSGSRLTEQMFSDEFSISRTPIREILHQLAALRLIELKPNTSAEVLGLSCDDIEELYDIRMVLEEMAIEEAIPKIRLHELSQIKSQIDEINDTKDFELLAKIDYELHSCIASCSGKPRLYSILDPFFMLLIRNAAFPIAERIEPMKREHLKIIEALMIRDVEAAKAALREHLLLSKSNAIGYLFSQPNNGIENS